MMRFAAKSAPKSAKGASGLLEGAPGADFETGHDSEDPSEAAARVRAKATATAVNDPADRACR